MSITEAAAAPKAAAPKLCACGCGQPTKPKGHPPKHKKVVLEYHDYLLNHRKKKDVATEFWKKAGVVDDDDSCWEWQGNFYHDGRYGRAYAGYYQDHDLAHRIAYKVQIGDIPPGLSVCHTCDNTRCVRGSHLFLGTTKDNSEDMVRKGRSFKGPKNRDAHYGPGNGLKLNKAKVQEIKCQLRRGVQQKQLAQRFKVSDSLISMIHRGKTWADVTCPATPSLASSS